MLIRQCRMCPHMENVEKLILMAQKGDRLAFKEIYQLFYKRIYRFIYMNTHDSEKAQDLCQETFIKIWKALPSFSLENGGSLQAYLFRIARNFIIDLYRKKKEISLEVIGEIEDNNNIDEKISREYDAQRLRKVLLKLEGVDRHVIILRYFEDLSFFEISQALKIKEGALRVRVHRALEKLKKLLETKNES